MISATNGNGMHFAPCSDMGNSSTDRLNATSTRFGNSDEYYTQYEKLTVKEHLMRAVKRLMPGSVYLVYEVIVDQSTGYGRPKWLGTAQRIADFCSISLRTVKRAIDWLRNTGWIETDAMVRKGTVFHVNVRMEGKKMALALPKRLRQQAENGDTVAPLSRSNSAKLAPPNKTTENHLLSVDDKPAYREEPDAHPEEFDRPAEETVAPLRKFHPDDLAADLAKVEARSAQRSEKAKAKLQQTGKASALEVVWQNILAEHYAGLPRPKWTRVQLGIMQSIGKRWASNGKIIEFGEFFEWCLLNWPAVIRKQFGWMTKSPPPRFPDFRFWSAHYERFFECYASGQLTKWMRAPDRDRLKFLILRGMTHEEAIYEIAKEQATANLQDEMRATRQQASAAERRTAENIKKLERMQQFGGTAPVHPKSEAAKKILGVQPVAPIGNGVNLDDLDASDIPAWEE